MSPSATDNMKSNLGQTGGHLKDAAGHAGDALKGAASAAGDEMRLGKAQVKGDLADSALSGIAALEQAGAAIDPRLAGATFAELPAAQRQAGLPLATSSTSTPASREQMDALMDKSRDLIDSASELIRERPLASFGVAFAAGWIIAKLARSGDK